MYSSRLVHRRSILSVSVMNAIQTITIREHQVKLIGNPEILNRDLLGIFCSQKCPGELILKTYDTVKKIREQNRVVISGFHSSLEKDIFEILLRGSQPVGLCLARNLEGYRIPRNLLEHLQRGRLFVLAPNYSNDEGRITRKTVEQRNALIFNLSNSILMVYAQPGGILERNFQWYRRDKQNVYALSSRFNDHLFHQGVISWNELD